MTIAINAWMIHIQGRRSRLSDRGVPHSSFSFSNLGSCQHVFLYFHERGVGHSLRVVAHFARPLPLPLHDEDEHCGCNQQRHQDGRHHHGSGGERGGG